MWFVILFGFGVRVAPSTGSRGRRHGGSESVTRSGARHSGHGFFFLFVFCCLFVFFLQLYHAESPKNRPFCFELSRFYLPLADRFLLFFPPSVREKEFFCPFFFSFLYSRQRIKDENASGIGIVSFLFLEARLSFFSFLFFPLFSCLFFSVFLCRRDIENKIACTEKGESRLGSGVTNYSRSKKTQLK